MLKYQCINRFVFIIFKKNFTMLRFQLVYVFLLLFIIPLTQFLLKKLACLHRPPLNLAPPPNLIFCSGLPQLFWSEIFRSPPKIGGGKGGGGGGCYHASASLCKLLVLSHLTGGYWYCICFLRP